MTLFGLKDTRPDQYVADNSLRNNINALFQGRIRARADNNDNAQGPRLRGPNVRTMADSNKDASNCFGGG